VRYDGGEEHWVFGIMTLVTVVRARVAGLDIGVGVVVIVVDQPPGKVVLPFGF